MDSKLKSFIVFTLCIAGLSSTAFGGQLVEETFKAKSYDGSRDRQYQVYIPSTYTGSEPVPMVMVLHGCKQTQQNMINETRFNDLAEQDNFIVVYPFITSYDGSRSPNCWGFWFDHHIHEGAGEAEDLYQIALEVESRFKIDPNRRYITGLSSGAAMSIVMAVAQSEYFAAAGAAAGLPYSETSSSVGFVCANPGTFKSVSSIVSAMQAEQQTSEEKRKVPLMVIHSTNDCTINKKGSENTRDSWIQHYGADSTAFETTDCTTEGVPCIHRKYGVPGRSVVETVFYEGERGDFIGQGSHYWVGDGFGDFANPEGPSAGELFWDFFKRHPFSENQAPLVSISSGSASGTSISVSGSASDPDGSVAEVAVRLDGQHMQPSKRASGTTSWSVTFDNLPDNAIYTPVATADDDKGATKSVTGTAIIVGTPPPNQAPLVTIDDVAVNVTCVTVKGTASDSDGTVTEVEVELGTQGFKPTGFNGNSYTYQECGLRGGNYTTKAKATDDAGASTTISGNSAEVEDLEVAVANWQGHMNAGRLRTYTAPCSNIGFGSCDAGFHTIFLTHSFDSFALYKDLASDDWYLDPGNIPSSSGSISSDN